MKFKILNPKKWTEPTYVWKYQSIPLGEDPSRHKWKMVDWDKNNPSKQMWPTVCVKGEYIVAMIRLPFDLIFKIISIKIFAFNLKDIIISSSVFFHFFGSNLVDVFRWIRDIWSPIRICIRKKANLGRDMRFPTMWYFDINIPRPACAIS